MGVLDTHILKSMAEEDILVTQSIQVRAKYMNQICDMVEFLIDNIFVKFGGDLYRQVIGIPVGTNCAAPLADLFFTLKKVIF